MKIAAGVVGGIFTGVLGIATFAYEYVDAERANAREQDLGFSQFAAKISRLEADLEQMDEELTQKEAEIAELRKSMGAIGSSDGSDVRKLEARIAALESRPHGAATSATPEQVASVLIRDYSSQLRGLQGPQGPQGPVGPQGPAGPRGEAGASGNPGSVNPNAPIKVSRDFSTDFEPQYFGSTKASLMGCAGKGVRVSCTMLLEPEESVNFHFQSRNGNIRAALPSAEWVEANEIKVGSQRDWVVGGSLSAGIPTRVDIAFNLPSGGHDGLLALEVFDGQSRTKAVWKNIPLTE